MPIKYNVKYNIPLLRKADIGHPFAGERVGGLPLLLLAAGSSNKTLTDPRRNYHIKGKTVSALRRERETERGGGASDGTDHDGRHNDWEKILCWGIMGVRRKPHRGYFPRKGRSVTSLYPEQGLVSPTALFPSRETDREIRPGVNWPRPLRIHVHNCFLAEREEMIEEGDRERGREGEKGRGGGRCFLRSSVPALLRFD